MKFIYFKSGIATLIIAILFSTLLSGCNKLAGLPLQTDAAYNGGIINNNSNMTAWEFIKSRSKGNGDGLFTLMYDAIIYSGVDTNLYKRPNTTYLLYNDSGIVFRSSSGAISSSSYWGFYKINKKAATSWTQYKSADSIALKNNLLYLLIDGKHSFENIPITYSQFNTVPNIGTPEFDTTFMPKGVNTLNPNSLISFNQSDSSGSYQSIYINSFPGSKFGLSTTNTQYPGLKVRTAGINIKDNSVIHVVDRVIYYQLK
jgi:hypothetical protein